MGGKAYKCIDIILFIRLAGYFNSMAIYVISKDIVIVPNKL